MPTHLLCGGVLSLLVARAGRGYSSFKISSILIIKALVSSSRAFFFSLLGWVKRERAQSEKRI